VTALQAIKVPADRTIQDYRSTYNDIRDWLRREKAGQRLKRAGQNIIAPKNPNQFCIAIDFG
jgi:hypothetical protein